jgi:hypothetical protein
LNQFIELIVSPQGETTLETKGFAGSGCQQASRFLEQALGSRDSEKLTAEYYQTLPASSSVQQQGGTP